MRLRGTRMDFSDSQEINRMKIVAGYGKQQQHSTEVKLQGIGNASLNSVPTKLPARGLRLETKCENNQVKPLGGRTGFLCFPDGSSYNWSTGRNSNQLANLMFIWLPFI